MKKTQFLELLKNIKKTLVSFISITMFVALSIAIYVGISWSSNAIVKSIDDVFEEYKAHDIELVFPYGIEDKDIEKLKTIEGVDEIEAGYTGYVFFNQDNTRYQAKLIQVRNEIDTPMLIEGVIPKEYNEIGLSEQFAREHGISVGDTITFNSDNDGSSRALVRILNLDEEDISALDLNDDNIMAYLKTNKFVVTSTMKSTEFMNINTNTFGVALTNNINIDCFIYLNKSAFDETSFAGYPDILIRSNELRDYPSYTSEYTEKVTELSNTIKETFGKEIANEKCEKIKTKINDAIETGQKQLDDAKKQIKDGEKQIEEGKIFLQNAKKQIDEGLPQLENAEKEIVKAEEEFDKYANLLNQVIDIYVKIAKNIVNDVDYVEKNEGLIVNICNYILQITERYDYPKIRGIVLNILDFIDSKNYDVARDYIINNLNVIYDFIEDIKKVLDGYNNEIQNKRIQLNEGWDTYNNGVSQYSLKKKELQEAEIKIADAKIQYQEGIDRLAVFKDSTNEFVEYGSTVITRSSNQALGSAITLKDMMGKLKYSMASLFVIVGLLVCYSAISRIVNDQIIDIGTKKALGITKKEVTSYYLSYTGTAILLGCIIGNLVGYLLVEPALVKSSASAYTVEFYSYFSMIDAIKISLLEIILLISVTYIACRKILNRNAFKLLQGPDVPQGKRRFYESFAIWERSSLFTKTIVNNCFNDKRRVFGTIVGIMGAASLIVTSLTLNDNILNSYDTQYEKISHFDTIVNYESTNGKLEIQKLLDKNNVKYSNVLSTRMLFKDTKGEYVLGFTYVSNDTEEFKNMFTLIPSHKYDSEPYKGVWISNSYGSQNKLKKDETISISTMSGETMEVVPSGYFEHYLAHCLIIMDKDTYKNEFNHEPTFNAFLVDGNDIDMNELKEELIKIDGYVSTIDHKEVTKGSFVVFETLSKALVAIYMALSVIMTFLVLLNLLTMFVDEKKRELIVLMINGYTVKQAKKYIYTDTIILSIISILLGCVVGSVMGNISVSSFESTQTYFLHQIDIKACLVSMVCTAFLTYVVTRIALKKVDGFKITDINKQ